MRHWENIQFFFLLYEISCLLFSNRFDLTFMLSKIKGCQRYPKGSNTQNHSFLFWVWRKKNWIKINIKNVLLHIQKKRKLYFWHLWNLFLCCGFMINKIINLMTIPWTFLSGLVPFGSDLNHRKRKKNVKCVQENTFPTISKNRFDLTFMLSKIKGCQRYPKGSNTQNHSFLFWVWFLSSFFPLNSFQNILYEKLTYNM
jgi:ssDNA-binding Zn-finger/Zn-ribbon topoisomerase 1